MLAALCAVRRGKALFCLHVDHGLRPAESRADAEFVRDFCEKRGIECTVATIPSGKITRFARRKGVGIEAAARFFRRRALFAEAARLGNNARILIAHTRDDMLETALMRVLRGSGPAGLAAMPVSRGRIIRPLLSVTRADVIGYLKEKNIPWREDSTNTDEKFFRNRVRRRLIPLLDELFPSWKTALSGLAETQSFTADFLAGEAQGRINWESENEELGTAHSPAKSDSPLLSTNAENFFAHPEIIREEAVFFAIDRLLTGREGSASVRRAVVRQFCVGGESAADLGPLKIRREGGKVVLTAVRSTAYESGFSLLIKEPGLYNLKNISIEVRPFSACNKESAFLAALPLVFRRGYKDDFLIVRGKKTHGGSAKNLISAVDVFGTAAFIGREGLIAGRDSFNARDGRELYIVIVKEVG